MGKMEKLLERLLSKPTDFTWEKLIRLLAHFGYVERKRAKQEVPGKNFRMTQILH